MIIPPVLKSTQQQHFDGFNTVIFTNSFRFPFIDGFLLRMDASQIFLFEIKRRETQLKAHQLIASHTHEVMTLFYLKKAETNEKI